MSPKHKVTTKQVRLSAYHPASDTMELPLLLKLPPGVSGSPSLQAALAPVRPAGTGAVENEVRTVTLAASSPPSGSLGWAPRVRGRVFEAGPTGKGRSEEKA